MPSAAQRELEAKLAVLNGPAWDSSDDESPAEPETKIAKTMKTKKPSQENKPGGKVYENEDPSEASSVIYIGHIPSNFEEAELRGFLGQFGQVTHVRLSRARKTANPRGYGFVQFDDPEVAAIAADTMSGYLMGEKRVVCHVLPKEKVHPNLFKGADREFKKVDWAARHRKRMDKPKTLEKMKEITQKLVRRERKKRNKLKEMGIDYDFPGYEASNKDFPMKLPEKVEAKAAEEAEEKSIEKPLTDEKKSIEKPLADEEKSIEKPLAVVKKSVKVTTKVEKKTKKLVEEAQSKRARTVPEVTVASTDSKKDKNKKRRKMSADDLELSSKTKKVSKKRKSI